MSKKVFTGLERETARTERDKAGMIATTKDWAETWLPARLECPVCKKEAKLLRGE